MKKKYYWIILIAVIAIFLVVLLQNLPFGTIYYTYPYSIKDEWKYCKEDKDCFLIDLDCCGGCVQSNLSINIIGSTEIEKWKGKNCKDIECPIHQCMIELPQTTLKAICSNGICSPKYELSYDSFCHWYCGEFECGYYYFFNEINESLKSLSNRLEDLKITTTVEEYRNSCNCANYCSEIDYHAVARQTACEFFFESNCSVSTTSIEVKNFDANENGKISIFPSYDPNDTLFELCKHWYSIDTESECEKLCKDWLKPQYASEQWKYRNCFSS